MRHRQCSMRQAHYARWSEVLKLERPGAADRANCPSGGYEFAQAVWRYVRLLAVAARTQGAKLGDDPVEFHKLDGYLDAYLQALQVHSHQHSATLCLGAQKSGMAAAEGAQFFGQCGICAHTFSHHGVHHRYHIIAMQATLAASLSAGSRKQGCPRGAVIAASGVHL